MTARMRAKCAPAGSSHSQRDPKSLRQLSSRTTANFLERLTHTDCPPQRLGHFDSHEPFIERRVNFTKRRALESRRVLGAALRDADNFSAEARSRIASHHFARAD